MAEAPGEDSLRTAQCSKYFGSSLEQFRPRDPSLNFEILVARTERRDAAPRY